MRGSSSCGASRRVNERVLRRIAIGTASVLCAALAFAAGARVDIAHFARGDTDGWKQKSFKGETIFSARNGGLCADSRGTASGLFREQAVDLTRTPLLHWSWKLVQPVQPAPGNERTKAGDDYAARVYVVFSGGLAFWRTRGINYVWSSAEPRGASWPNAFTANVRMIAQRSGAAGAGEWISETRDVRADYRALFGADIEQADAVAIMTDTDNAGGRAQACYGDMWFTDL